jgi:hypothetical protein
MTIALNRSCIPFQTQLANFNFQPINGSVLPSYAFCPAPEGKNYRLDSSFTNPNMTAHSAARSVVPVLWICRQVTVNGVNKTIILCVPAIWDRVLTNGTLATSSALGWFRLDDFRHTFQ